MGCLCGPKILESLTEIVVLVKVVPYAGGGSGPRDAP